MRIHTVPCLSDNLSYLVVDDDTRTCVIVDPSEATPFLETIRAQGLKLIAVLTTHHHYDHIGGLAELPEVPVWSSTRDRDRIPGAGHSQERYFYDDAKVFSWSDLASGGVTRAAAETHAPPSLNAVTIKLRTRRIPGHTEGQTALLISSSSDFESGKDLHVFVGDTLFALGCGRCLEGTPELLFESLQYLKTLPADAKFYFGHEYTEKNALFWLSHATHTATTSTVSRATSAIHESLVIDAAEIKKILVEYSSKRLPVAAPSVAEEVARNPFLQIKNASEFRRWRELRNQF